jgi:hypothetical protein
MGTLFISHSSKNNAEATKVLDWLKEKGWSKIFLDIDPNSGLAPGQHWRDELRNANRQCEAVLLLLSPHWIASKWCFAEFLLASELGKPIFPVIVQKVEFSEIPIEIAADYQIVDLTSVDTAGALAALAKGLQRAGIDPDSFKWPPADEPNRIPYRGLETYETKDAAVYFGREDLTSSTRYASRHSFDTDKPAASDYSRCIRKRKVIVSSGRSPVETGAARRRVSDTEAGSTRGRPSGRRAGPVCIAFPDAGARRH